MMADTPGQGRPQHDDSPGARPPITEMQQMEQQYASDQAQAAAAQAEAERAQAA